MNAYEERLREITFLTKMIKNENDKEELIKERNDLLKILIGK